MKGNKYFPEGRQDDESFVEGEDPVTIMGGFVSDHAGEAINNGNIGAVIMDGFRRLITISKAPNMDTDRLAATGDGTSDTIAAPGVGYALEVYGYMITQHEEAAMNIVTPAFLRFDAAQYIWVGINTESGVARNHISIASGLCIQGADNEALTLTNTDDFAAAQGSVVAVIYYAIVTALP